VIEKVCKNHRFVESLRDFAQVFFLLLSFRKISQN